MHWEGPALKHVKQEVSHNLQVLSDKSLYRLDGHVDKHAAGAGVVCKKSPDLQVRQEFMPPILQLRQEVSQFWHIKVPTSGYLPIGHVDRHVLGPTKA